MSKSSQLQELKDKILAQEAGTELASTATQLVFGDGNPDAQVVLVGEAPGKKEDQTGLPFVGASGRFLNELLALIGLKRQDIYITNIVKFRPPNNRDPLASEKAAFLPYLLRQIDIIKPKLIVTLGRHSMDCFLPGLKISQVHGQASRKDGRLYLPLYHPAAALYNGSMRQTLIDDFAKIAAILSPQI